MRKYQEIADTLETEFATAAPHTRLPGDRDLAARFGVATETVRNALRELKRTGFLTTRHGVGTFTTGKDAGRPAIGVLVSGCNYSEVFGVMCREIIRAAEERQIRVIVKDTSCADVEETANRTSKLALELAASRVSGIIYQPVQFASSAFRTNCTVLDLFAEARIPVTVIDCELAEYPANLSYDLVSIDNFLAGQTLGAWLIQTGSRHLCFQACSRYAVSVADRIRGVRSVTNGPVHVMELDPRDPNAVQSELLRVPFADAIICQNDLAAVHMAETLQKLGHRVPEDIRIAGFDGVAISEQAGIPTMKQPCEDLARGAVSCLLERISRPKSSNMRLLRQARLLPRG